MDTRARYTMGRSEVPEREPLMYQKPIRTWAGRGSGDLCALCNRPILADNVEYEVELTSQSAVQVLHLHVTCHRKWAGC